MPRRQSGNAAAADTDALLALDNQFCFALHSASRMVVRSYRPALEALDLTYSQYLVMLVLWEWTRSRHPHPSVSELGARLDLDSGTLTPLLRRLEQKGLLVRERSQDDERELFVRLTPAGQAMKQRARKVPLSLLEQSVMPLQEMFELRDQLKRVRAAMLEAQGGRLDRHFRGSDVSTGDRL